MMKKVEVLSREMIKPSSSTPLHLKHYKQSLLDQFAPNSYIRFVLIFYNKTPNQENIQKLKKSLADSLTLYYPLAGKYIKDQSLIDCNDDGALFIEARVEGDVADSDIQLEHLLPAGHDLSETQDEILMAVQATHFSTNGISIGICVTHKIIDGVGVAAFIKCWGALATDKEFDPPVMFEASKIWPPMEKNPPSYLPDKPPKGEMVMKKICFSAIDIANLIEKAKGKDRPLPSRVVAVKALLWRCLILTMTMTVTEESSLVKPKPKVVMFFPVNLRPRIVPPLGETSFGSINKTVMILAAPDEDDVGIDELAARISAAVRKVDDGYARNREIFHGRFLIHEPFRGEIFGETAEMKYCGVASWCGFGLYKTNLGWGRPDEVRCLPTVSNINSALLIDAKDGVGVEVLLNMGSEEMEFFLKLPDLIV